MTDPAFRQHPGTLRRRLPDGVLLLAPAATEPIVITGPGADLWDLLARPDAFASAADTIARAYAGDPDQVRRDLAPVWDRLVAVGALTPAP